MIRNRHSLANSRSIPVTPHSNIGKIKYGHLKTRRVTDIWILCFQFRNSGAWKTSFFGTPVCFKEKIPYTAENSQQKWNMVKSLFSRSDEPLFVSNAISKENKLNDNFIINSIFWAKRTLKYWGKIDEGLFAYFTYHGSIKDYVFHINNIYMNVLPYYGLQKETHMIWR